MKPRGGLALQLALISSLAIRCRATDVTEAISELPPCGSECFTSLIATSTCGLNVTCICTSHDFYKTASSCILEKCSPPDALKIARLEAGVCNRPRRSRKSDILIPLVIEVPAWFCPWLRTYSRWKVSKKLALDDWFMLVCGLFYSVFLALGIYAGNRSFGKDTWYTDTDLIIEGLKVFYVDESFYLVCLCLTKISVLVFFLRIFPNQSFRYATFAAMGFVALPTTIFVFLQIFQCTPVSYVWKGWMNESAGHNCLDVNLLAYTAAAFSIAQDVVILVLPLPLLFGLNTNLRAKMGIMLMFNLGVFILATSCVRMRYIVSFAHTSNPTWDFVDPLIWSGIEVAVSIVVACLPAIRALLISIVPGLITSVKCGKTRSSRNGYVRETSSASSKTGNGAPVHAVPRGPRKLKKRSGLRNSLVFLGSKDTGQPHNESEIELGLQLGDKSRGHVRTEIYGSDADQKMRDEGGVQVDTVTTSTRANHRR